MFHITHRVLGLNPVGSKTNRKIEVADSTARKTVRKPSASKLKSMGYTASQREAILSAWA